MTQNTNKQGLFIGIIAMLLIVLAGLSYYVYQMKTEQNLTMGELSDKKEELELTYSQLDSVSIRLKETLNEKERMGEKDDSLRAVIELLEEEKLALKNSGSLSVARYNQIKAKLGQYEQLLATKDNEIAKLRDQNEDLENKNNELERDRTGLTGELRELEQDKSLIEDRLNEASALKAYSIRTTAINKKGKTKTGGTYRVKYIKKLQVELRVGENKAADAGNRKILMRVINPSKTVLAGSESGSFNFGGNEVPYSITKEILFDTNEQNIKIIFENNQSYQKGKHTIELYTEGNLMGKGNFIIK